MNDKIINLFCDALNDITLSKIYQNNNVSNYHKIEHIQKVMFFSLCLAKEEKLSDNQIKLLIIASAFHDCAKKQDKHDSEHGINSALKMKKYCEGNYQIKYNLTENDIKLIQLLIAYHNVSEKELGKVDIEKILELAKILNFYINKDNINNIKILCAILKDADALDRFRFSSNNLKIEKLRTNIAKTPKIIIKKYKF